MSAGHIYVDALSFCKAAASTRRHRFISGPRAAVRLDLGTVQRGGGVRVGAECGTGRQQRAGLGDPLSGWRARDVRGGQGLGACPECTLGGIISVRQPSVGAEGAISVDSAGGYTDGQLRGCSVGAAGPEPRG